MNLDDSYIEPYLQDWLSYIRKSSDAEQQVIKEAKEFCVPYGGVPVDAIKAIFIISGRFGIEHEAKYLAVHLLDRYVVCMFRERMSSLEEVNAEALQQVRQNICSQIKLVLVSCLQIASKVDLYRTGLNISHVQDVLQSVDPLRDYSRECIFASELRILRTLDFRIPVSLPLSVLEVFLAYSKLPANSSGQSVRETCLHLLDIAYTRHEHLFRQLHLMARGFDYDKSKLECRDFLRLEANAGFVGAAVVVCSTFFFQLKKSLVDSLTAKLAKVLGMDPIDLGAMANLLFMSALDEEDFVEVRRQSDDDDDDDDDEESAPDEVE